MLQLILKFEQILQFIKPGTSRAVVFAFAKYLGRLTAETHCLQLHDAR